MRILARALMVVGRKGVLEDNGSPATDVRMLGKKGILMGYCSSNERCVTYSTNDQIIYK